MNPRDDYDNDYVGDGDGLTASWKSSWKVSRNVPRKASQTFSWKRHGDVTQCATLHITQRLLKSTY